MSGPEQRLREELGALCRGWGLHRKKLHVLIGRAVAEWANVSGNASDYDVRMQITRAIDRLIPQGLLSDQLRAVRVALAIEPGVQFRSLKERTETLASEYNVSDRTMRRWINDALDHLSHLAVTSAGAEDHDHGWAVERLKTLVRLDDDMPLVIEQRTVVATVDGLERVSARFSLPCEPGTPTQARDVVAEVMHGARIKCEHRDGLGHFRYDLALPNPLARGQELTYTMAFRVVDGLPIRNYYAVVPVVTCSSLVITVRFGLSRLPTAVWKIDEVHHRVLSDPLKPGDGTLPLNGAGEVTVPFAALKPSFGYGVAWHL
ncbi:hypothetical protein [Lentzea sp. CC55]|uniref:hypothetical protein n=1 Tax=Lentzea sp. CC55 TaxID=2884909 RepID=UPI001F21DB00|nr:hypothetical protein [Lentzea sp. CC55]MCG8925147.1 hypothetical protein [Lentzea sp. CC55]